MVDEAPAHLKVYIALAAITLAALVLAAVEIVLPYLARLLRVVRIWWTSGLFTLPDSISYRAIARDGRMEVRVGRPAGIRGLHILVITDKGQDMVVAGQALNRSLFWKTWKHLGGQPVWRTSDGDTVDVTEL